MRRASAGTTLPVLARLVTYHLDDLALGHAAYMAALGVGGRAQYPRVAEDPLAAFHDLAHDLKELTISDFLEGSGEILRREAARVSADAPRGQREYMAQAAGDVSKREHARERFRAGDYATVRALLEGLQYPDLATEVERGMLEVARARTT